MKYSSSKWEATTGSLWEAQTKAAKIDCFTKNLFPPTDFEINTSNFQEIFLDIFKKFRLKEFKKIYKKNQQKKQFFFNF